jgi:hypothetical protein
MQALIDGSYSVIVVDAFEDTARGGFHLELAITQGPAKGEVVSLHASSTTRSAIDLLGLPATLEVQNGVPRVIFDSV